MDRSRNRATATCHRYFNYENHPCICYDYDRSSRGTLAQAEKLADSLQGSLVRLNQDAIVKAEPDALAGKKLIAVYYSAHWCPPCRAFTPELVKFYDETKANHPDFELVFVSSDHSAKEMKEYMIWVR